MAGTQGRWHFGGGWRSPRTPVEDGRRGLGLCIAHRGILGQREAPRGHGSRARDSGASEAATGPAKRSFGRGDDHGASVGIGRSGAWSLVLVLSSSYATS